MTWRSLVDGVLPPRFERRVVTVDPGCARAYDEREWLDAIVVVHRGEIELHGTCGGAHSFRRGDMLWLAGLPLVELRNGGDEPAVLAAVSRRDPPPTPEGTDAMADAGTRPTTDVDARFSSPGARATPWAVARRDAAEAEIWWLATVRPDGRPHVTPVLAVLRDDALHFCTGPDERKARNLDANPHVVLTTGANRAVEGLDVVLEGEAERVTDDAELHVLADAWVAKYGEEWRFEVRDGRFHQHAGPADVYRVTPSVGFGFGRGDTYSQTRWRFAGRRQLPAGG